jgi:hypothetical protein
MRMAIQEHGRPFNLEEQTRAIERGMAGLHYTK